MDELSHVAVEVEHSLQALLAAYRAVADNIRDIEKALNIPDLIKEGGVSYGMQTFDQSLMKWYKDGAVTYEDALFFSSNPSEFALRASGIDSASDRTFTEITGEPDAASGRGG